MSYPLAVGLIVGIIATIVIWTGSLFFDYDLARQLLLAALAGAFTYLIVDFSETFGDDEV